MTDVVYTKDVRNKVREEIGYEDTHASTLKPKNAEQETNLIDDRERKGNGRRQKKRLAREMIRI